MHYLSSKSKPLVLGNYEITLGSQTVLYTLKRSLRARLIWLQINREGNLCVTVPRHYDLVDLPQYLISKSRWILRHLKSFQTELPFSFSNGSAHQPQVCYKGSPLESFGEDHNQTFRLPDGTAVDNTELVFWLKQQAQKVILSRAQLFSDKIGVSFARISIRDQKTRWGSCSQAGNLNFNWRLIMAPEPVLDYVVIHELCHLKRMSHGKSFWNVVAKYCSDWKEKRRWLNKHSRELHYFHSSSV